ncbi:MAG: twin transmembrane helix small protein [Gammaproteobacteria bacterium]|nr:twin transmembrane helix small protein [Gammaproteobacteria bacterium]
MLIKILVIVALLAIVSSLFSGLLFLYKDRSGSDRVVKALTVRVAISVILFLLLMAGYYFGLIPAQGVFR